jgi:hypothetical protein
MRRSALAAILLLCPQIILASAQPILFIMDASGSMGESFQGVTRMAAARVLLGEQIQKLPIGTKAGFVAYGNGIPGCDSYRLYAPIARSSTGAIPGIMQKLVASGETPIAGTLRQVGKGILAKENNVRIVLISDGKESCGGNPDAEAAILRSRGHQVHVIGLGVDEPTAVQLRRIAGMGGGVYFHVQTNTDFIDAIHRTTDPLAQPVAPVTEEPGGPAVPLPAENEQKDEPVPSGDGLVLTRIRSTELPNGRVRVEVDYRFRWEPLSDFSVSLQISDGRRIHEVYGAASHVHRQTQTGNGTLAFELDPSEVRGNSFLVTGELWDIEKVPGRVSVSQLRR